MGVVAWVADAQSHEFDFRARESDVSSRQYSTPRIVQAMELLLRRSVRALEPPAMFFYNNLNRYSVELMCHSVAKMIMLGRMAQHAARSSKNDSQVNATARVVVEVCCDFRF